MIQESEVKKDLKETLDLLVHQVRQLIYLLFFQQLAGRTSVAYISILYLRSQFFG